MSEDNNKEDKSKTNVSDKKTKAEDTQAKKSITKKTSAKTTESTPEKTQANPENQSDEAQPKKKIKNVRDVIIESIECEPGIAGCTADPDTCPNGPNVCDKKLSMFGYYDDTITDSIEHVLSRSMDELTQTFTASARRWELIVYPSMFAFVLLATYGFFLIYSLTQDVGTVAEEMKTIGKNMTTMTVHMDSISKNMVNMTQTMHGQSITMAEMNKNMVNMSMSMNQMRHDISIMNNSVSRPMQFMNDFMPW
ncbi:MAG: hypothetical protein OQL06_03320 [Gammaproteobacteria bacterium]|nr:hypothetical protein [Gammaproteobacteria bacterium]